MNEVQVDCELPRIAMESKITFKIYDSFYSDNNPKSNFIKINPIQEKVDELKRKYKFKYSSDELNIPAKMTVTEIVQ